MRANKTAQRIVKRLIDIIGAVVALVLLVPIFVIVAAFVRIKLGAPVFFRQARPGMNGEVFHMVKFRTMLDATGSDGTPLPDDQRLTDFGRKLRASSLDELPELWNILIGDMSLVGPRPLLIKYLPLYSAEQARRHEMRPGLTGWAQVNGRNSLSWEDKFALDVWYVDHASLWLDLKIIWLTIRKVIKREGISTDGHETMTEFTGRDERS